MTTVGFIGAGKVGTSLGKYFSRLGCSISGYYSRSKGSAQSAAEFTQSIAYETTQALVESSDWIFITTADSAIGQIWQEVSAMDIEGKAVCHCSGALSSLIFDGIRETGAEGYSVHPMHSFADKFSSYQTLGSSSISIEGTGEHKEELIRLFTSAGNTVLQLHTEKKALYHAANVAASNLVLALVSKSAEYLTECGIEKDDALKALMPLVRNNIENIAGSGFAGALTGPVERNDSMTVSKHLEVIPDSDLNLYQALSAELLTIAEEKHPEHDYAQMRGLLNLTD